MLSSDQTLSDGSHSITVQVRVLLGAHKTMHNLPCHLPALNSLLAPAPAPPALLCSPNTAGMFLPQGFCTGCSCCLERCSWTPLHLYDLYSDVTSSTRPSLLCVPWTHSRLYLFNLLMFLIIIFLAPLGFLLHRGRNVCCGSTKVSTKGLSGAWMNAQC